MCQCHIYMFFVIYNHEKITPKRYMYLNLYSIYTVNVAYLLDSGIGNLAHCFVNYLQLHTGHQF